MAEASGGSHQEPGREPAPVNLPAPCVVVLAGPGAAGKSTWAEAHFPPEVIISSDRLRALAGAGEDDITASADALDLLEQIVAMRLRRGLSTVIDTLGLDPAKRRAWLEAARAHGLPCYAVEFDTPAAVCRERNRGRAKRIPADVLSGQLRRWPRSRELLRSEGFDGVLAAPVVRLVPRAFAEPRPAERTSEEPVPGARQGLRFGLHLSRFAFTGAPRATRGALREIAGAAEAAGFDAIYVMDHFRQIPQVGRAWEDMLESYSTLAYLAAVTERVRLGALVSGITYRNVAHLGKIVATLDVLSGGRAVCGLGLAWFKAEHAAYGWDFPATAERYRLLEDALQLLPVLWGPGTRAYEGAALRVPEAMCYPRPLQKRVPIIVGGGGERRTLRLAARYADVSNVLGGVEDVRRKAAVLAAHCRDAGRDPAEVTLSHLSTTLMGEDDRHVRHLVEELRPARWSAASFAETMNAGTLTDHIRRFSDLAEAGAREVVISLPDLTGPEPLERAAKVISAFR